MGKSFTKSIYGSNIQYIVTSLADFRTRDLYKKGYCARGSMELRIKDHKLYLKSDRSSCSKFTANQFRLFLHSMAYILIHTLQKQVLKGSEYANATMKTIQLKIIENKLIERDSKNRIAKINKVIGEYKLTSGFDDTKALVHSIIKKITIQHNYRKDAKGGYFLINIEYRGFDESITFLTGWNALKWYQIGYYRSRAITKEDLQDDIDLLKYFIKASGKKIEVPKDFVGFEAYRGGKGESIIELQQDELINFD